MGKNKADTNAVSRAILQRMQNAGRQPNREGRRVANNKTTRKYLAARPSVSQWRVLLVCNMVLAAAISAVIYDAYVSYDGFVKMGLPGHAPFIFAGMIFVTQLGIGVLHGMGANFTKISADSGDTFLDDAWIQVLFALYGIDLFSNGVSFGLLEGGWQSFIDRPVDRVGNALMVILFSVVLTFGDEILLRIYDKIMKVAIENGIISKKYGIYTKAHKKYLAKVQQQVFEAAERKAEQEASSWDYGDGL